jgi:nitroreductase
MAEDKDILKAIRQRQSVRSYADRPVPADLLDHLLAQANTVDHLLRRPPRIGLVSGVERTRRVLTYTIGSYGLIQDPPHLLIGVLSEESDTSRIELGYLLEQIVLEATIHDLGTCWVGASFDTQRAGEAVGLRPGESVAAVCALGYPAKAGWGRLHSRAVRRLAGGHHRTPLPEIVFSNEWGAAWEPNQADETLRTVLEHARLAPSGANRQPWRFIVRPADMVLATARHAPVDAGIVMSHVALAADALGWNAHWQLRLGSTELAEECALPSRARLIGVFA